MKEKAEKLLQAAKAWEDLEMPDFTVKGYLHGKHKEWDVPGVLREAANQIHERIVAEKILANS